MISLPSWTMIVSILAVDLVVARAKRGHRLESLLGGWNRLDPFLVELQVEHRCLLKLASLRRLPVTATVGCRPR